MLGQRGLALVLSCAGAVALAAACVDLFHSTNFETACDLDAGILGCPTEASMNAEGTDFCEWSSLTARDHAEHACAWLGACSAPFDRNAFGPCMIDAILAYDCKTNPNRPVRGALHEFWDTLWQAQSCEAVTKALDPQREGCGSVGYGCSPDDAAPSVLFECTSLHSSALPENCLVQGRVCDKGACTPPGASASCPVSECVGSVLRDCEDGQDMGYDCQYFGAGACTGEVDAAACSPADAGVRCAPTTLATCDSGVAMACATGRAESVDCNLLTGDDSCHPGALTPRWNLAQACEGKGTCMPGCDGGTVIGCEQGEEYTTSCAEEGLGPCVAVAIVGTGGNVDGYACAPPGE
jgi:hypothetical protein